MNEKYLMNEETQEIPHQSNAGDLAGLQHQLVRVTEQGVEVDRYAVKAGVVTIGRLRSNHVQFKDNSVSRRHARLWIVAKTCWLEDLGSHNGIIVNGEKVKLHRLQTGDLIQIGAINLKFVVTDAVSMARPFAVAQ